MSSLASLEFKTLLAAKKERERKGGKLIKTCAVKDIYTATAGGKLRAETFDSVLAKTNIPLSGEPTPRASPLAAYR